MLDAAAAVENVPATQLVQALAAVDDHVPGPHELHVLPVEAPVASDAEPGAQARQANDEAAPVVVE